MVPEGLASETVTTTVGTWPERTASLCSRPLGEAVSKTQGPRTPCHVSPANAQNIALEHRDSNADLSSGIPLRWDDEEHWAGRSYGEAAFRPVNSPDRDSSLSGTAKPTPPPGAGQRRFPLASADADGALGEGCEGVLRAEIDGRRIGVAQG